MSQTQFDSVVSNGNGTANGALEESDQFLVDAAINHMNMVLNNSATSTPSSVHSDQHPGFVGQSENKMSLLNDSNNNSLNGSLNGGIVGQSTNKTNIYGQMNGGGSINMAIGGLTDKLVAGTAAAVAAGLGSPLMMKPPAMNMQFYQQQWQQQQQQQQHQFQSNRQQQYQLLQSLQEQQHHQHHHRLQHHSNMPKSAHSPNSGATAALNGEFDQNRMYYKINNSPSSSSPSIICNQQCIINHHHKCILIVVTYQLKCSSNHNSYGLSSFHLRVLFECL